MAVSRPPRDDLYRALRPSPQLRAAAADGGMPTLFGHFAVFNRFTEIDSIWEGNFLEQLSKGAFAKTFQENRDGIRVLFQHGMDPQIGNKVLGRAEQLKEDATGAYYEVPLLDTSYNRDLIPGLEAEQYGASFRFRVVKEEFNKDPGISDGNPKGLPERTIREVELMEFGPVTFPAYADATAGVRSLTDEFHIEQLLRNPERMRELLLSRTTEDVSTSEPGDEPTPEEDEDQEPAEATPPQDQEPGEPTPPTDATPRGLPRHDEWIRLRNAKERTRA